MSVFIGQSNNGKFSLGSEYNATRFREDLRKNNGSKYRIQRITPESREMRGFFEGAVIPLACFYQENLDHRNNEHRIMMREWLKLEFCPETVEIGGKRHKVPKSTKGGKALRNITEKTIEWIEEQGGQTKVLNPNEYKHWRDAIFPYGGPDNYIDFLVSERRLKVV